jgi:hypothetical protein
MVGIALFWALGLISAKMYQCASRHAGLNRPGIAGGHFV